MYNIGMGCLHFSVLFASLNVKKDKMLIDGAINIVNIAIWGLVCNFFQIPQNEPKSRCSRPFWGVYRLVWARRFCPGTAKR